MSDQNQPCSGDVAPHHKGNSSSGNQSEITCESHNSAMGQVNNDDAVPSDDTLAFALGLDDDFAIAASRDNQILRLTQRKNALAIKRKELQGEIDRSRKEQKQLQEAEKVLQRDVATAQDKLADVEIVEVLVAFEPSLWTEGLVRRLRDLINRVPEQATSTHVTTTDTLARMSFKFDFKNVKGPEFTIMCVNAKKISDVSFARAQDYRQSQGEPRLSDAEQLTWFADVLGSTEARLESTWADSAEYKAKWARYLSYGHFVLNMARLVGSEGAAVLFPFEDIYPTRGDMSTLREYGRHWLTHRVQREPLRSILSKLSLIIMSATDGEITTNGLAPCKHVVDVRKWKASVNKMLDHFLDPGNNFSVKLNRLYEANIYDRWGNRFELILTAKHIAQLDSPDQWLNDDCIQAVILYSTRSCKWTYVPPSVLLGIKSEQEAAGIDRENEQCSMFFLLLSAMDGSSEKYGTHFACAAVSLDFRNQPKTAEVHILDCSVELGLYNQYEAQISRWLGEPFDITFNHPNVFQQRDSYDCGIHVIAQGISLMNTYQEYEGDLGTKACSSLRREYRNLLERRMFKLPHQEIDDV